MKKLRYVSAVMTGEKHEGGSLLAIFKDPIDAIEYARNYMKLHPGLGWKPAIHLGHDLSYQWESGCDWLEVRRQEVL